MSWLNSSRNNTSSENRQFSKVNFKSNESIAEFVHSRWENRAATRQGMERQWFLNIAQYMSRQYHHFDTYTQKLVEKDNPAGRVRLTCNKILPSTRKFVAKFMRQKPIWTCLPATNDRKDHIKAVLSTKILRYQHRVQQMDRKLEEFATWLATTGNAFIRAVWDPDKSMEIAFSDEDLQGLPDYMTEVAQNGINLGDIDVSVRSPFCIEVDGSATSMEDAMWLLDSSAVPIDKLKARYGKKGADLVPDTSSGNSLTSYYQKKIQDFNSGVGVSGLGFAGEQDDNDTVMVHELWVKPNGKNRGYHCVVANEKVLQKSDSLPSDFRVIPYGHSIQIRVPGNFWGQSCIEHAISLQASYNKGRSQLLHARNLTAKPKILEPNGSKIAQSAFSDVAGERIKYTFPLKPEYMSLPQMPEFVYKILEYDLRDMEDVLGIHEVSNSRTPSGVRAGVAITALQEMDDQTQAPVFQNAEKVLSDLGSWMLQLTAKHVTEERIVRVVGDEHEVDSFTFVGADLIGPNATRPGVNYFDVECQMGSQLPLSRAQRTQFVIDLVNAGIFDRVGDSKRIKQMLDLGFEEPGMKADQLDRQNALREHREMREGIMVEPQPQDNDMIHWEEHEIFMKTSEYRELVQADPSFEMRMNTHMAWTQMQMQGVPNPMAGMLPSEEGEEGAGEGSGSPEDIASMMAQGGGQQAP